MDQNKLDRELDGFTEWFHEWEQTARVLFTWTSGYADLLQQEEFSKDLSAEERRKYAKIIHRNIIHLCDQWGKVSSYLRLYYGDKITPETVHLSKVIAEITEHLEYKGIGIKVEITDNLPSVRGHSSWLIQAILGCITDWYYPTNRYEAKLTHAIRADLAGEKIKVRVQTISNADALYYPSTGVYLAMLVVEQLGGQLELDYTHQAAKVCFTLLPGSDST